jgi:hypothetical protein
MSGPVRWPVMRRRALATWTDSPSFPDRRRRRSTAKSRGLRPVPCAMRLTSVRAPADGGSLSSLTVRARQVRPLRRRTPGGGRHGTYQEGRQHHDARRREQPHQARAAGERPNGPGRRPREPGRKPRRPRPCGPRLRRRWQRNRPRHVLVWCRGAAQADLTVTDRMLRWWAGGRGWPSTALSMSARPAPAWSCPITGPAGATTPERTSGA